MKTIFFSALLVGLQLPLSPQFTENFSDNNLLSNPRWAGNTELFVVNDMEQLQLNAAEAGTAYLSTGSEAVDNATWEFDIQLDFNPSGANFAKIYLISNVEDLSSEIHGYFVKIGGTNDEISLYRQDGLEEIEIIDGRDDRVDENPVIVRIKVARDDLGNFELFSVKNTESDFLTEGTASDNTYNQSQYFGIVSQFTKTRADKFFFDNIKVEGDSFQDKSPPQFLGKEVISNKKLQLNFSEPLDDNTAFKVENYLLNGTVNPAKAALGTNDKTKVQLVFDVPFENGRLNSLLVTGIEDSVGNKTDSLRFEFIYFQQEVASPNDVVINEIMQDPSPALQLPEIEYLELYNRSNKTFSLKDWTLSDSRSSTNLDSIILFPNEYLILCPAGGIEEFEPFGKVLGVRNWPTLNNNLDSLSLKSKRDILIYEIAYSRAWFEDEEKENGGYSLEQINPASLCAEHGFNWTGSQDEDGGTPGRVNSVLSEAPLEPLNLLTLSLKSDLELQLVFNQPIDSNSLNKENIQINNGLKIASVTAEAPTEASIIFQKPIVPGIIYAIRLKMIEDCDHNFKVSFENYFGRGELPEFNDLIITEIMSTPVPSVGLPEVEYLELFNSSDKLLNLDRIKLSDRTSQTSISGGMLKPGDFLILTSTGGVEELQSFGNVLGVSNWPGLNKTNDAITLQDSTGNIIFNVEYDDSWYDYADKKEGGYALEMIDPTSLCADHNFNWTGSGDLNGGTPGKINSVFGATTPNPPDLQALDLISRKEIRLVFDRPIDIGSLNKNHITIDNGAQVAAISSEDPTMATIAFQESITPGTIYTIRLEMIKDCDRKITAGYESYFGLGKSPGFNELIITEIMATPEPSAGLPEVEYLELLNVSDQLLDLNRITLSDRNSKTSIPDGMLRPGNYLILTSTGSVEELQPFGNVLGVSNWPGLNKTSDAITLLDSIGNIIFNVEYDESWFDNAEKKQGGHAIEMIDTSNPCGEDENWTASKHKMGGTPGIGNSVVGSRPDNLGPKVISAIVIDSSLIEITFDEKILPASLAYVMTGIEPDVQISALVQKSPALKKLLLSTEGALRNQQRYNISIENLKDCSGNLNRKEEDIYFVVPEKADSGDILISELLFDPVPEGIDFLELYNTSEKYINLQNWMIANEKDTSVITSGNEIVGPFEFRVLTEDPDHLKSLHPNGREENFLPAELPVFTNQEGQVNIISSNGELIDAFDYKDEMHHPLLETTEGVSLERLSFEASTNSPDNWTSASSADNFSTPGFVNSNMRSLPEQVAEIEVQPKAFSPLSSQPNFATIRYKLRQNGMIGNIAVYDSRGREIKSIAENYLLPEKGFFTWDGTDNRNSRARSGMYIVLFEVFNLDGNKKTFKELVAIAPGP